MDYQGRFELNEITHSFQIFLSISWKNCGWSHFISNLGRMMSYPWFSLKLINDMPLSLCQILIVNIGKHIEFGLAILFVLLNTKWLDCLITPDADILNKIIRTFFKQKLLLLFLLLRYFKFLDALILVEGIFHINEFQLAISTL